MQKTSLPEAVDWCRLQKGADKYPFFVIRTDPLFWKNIKINSDTIPMDIEASVTRVYLEEIHPGIYRTKKKAADEQPEDPRAEILEHLRKMEEQQLQSEKI
uniref:Uncharacterized protein n=1 Tax=Panagrolaimus superbus TaxID=310955 RepID=A0A914XT88_9BILA